MNNLSKEFASQPNFWYRLMGSTVLKKSIHICIVFGPILGKTVCNDTNDDGADSALFSFQTVCA